MRSVHSLLVALVLGLAACGTSDNRSDPSGPSGGRSDAKLLHQCSGTEPFWSLRISHSGLSFESLGDEAFAMPAVEAVSAISGGGTVSHTKNAVTGAEVSITLLAGECNESMPENIYQYHVLLRDQDRVLYGCCDLSGQGPTQPLPQVAATKEHSCSGTEPFWSLKIAASGITLSDPLEAIQMPAAEPVGATGMADDFTMVYRTRDPKSGASVAISFIKGLCTDGMSEAEYGYNVLVERGANILLVGCCDENKKATDGRVTGCPSDRQCMLCKTGPGTTGNICIPKGAMC